MDLELNLQYNSLSIAKNSRGLGNARQFQSDSLGQKDEGKGGELYDVCEFHSGFGPVETTLGMPA